MEWGEQLCGWIENWLTNRKQGVGITGEASDWLQVTSGVAQVYVLGPLVFWLYINYLDCGIVSRQSKFTDGTKLGGKVGSRDHCGAIQRDLDNLRTWSDKWLLKFQWRQV